MLKNLAKTVSIDEERLPFGMQKKGARRLVVYATRLGLGEVVRKGQVAWDIVRMLRGIERIRGGFRHLFKTPGELVSSLAISSVAGYCPEAAFENLCATAALGARDFQATEVRGSTFIVHEFYLYDLAGFIHLFVDGTVEGLDACALADRFSERFRDRVLAEALENCCTRASLRFFPLGQVLRGAVSERAAAVWRTFWLRMLLPLANDSRLTLDLSYFEEHVAPHSPRLATLRRLNEGLVAIRERLVQRALEESFRVAAEDMGESIRSFLG